MIWTDTKDQSFYSHGYAEGFISLKTRLKLEKMKFLLRLRSSDRTGSEPQRPSNQNNPSLTRSERVKRNRGRAEPGKAPLSHVTPAPLFLPGFKCGATVTSDLLGENKKLP